MKRGCKGGVESGGFKRRVERELKKKISKETNCQKKYFAKEILLKKNNCQKKINC